MRGMEIKELEPVAAISDPPAHEANRNRGEQRPPQRQEKIGGQTQDDKECPENLFLHTRILARRADGHRLSRPRAAEEISVRAHAL